MREQNPEKYRKYTQSRDWHGKMRDFLINLQKILLNKSSSDRFSTEVSYIVLVMVLLGVFENIDEGLTSSPGKRKVDQGQFYG